MTNPATPAPPTPVNVMNWFEVATDDPDTAQAFYSAVFGWTFQPFPDPSVDYRVATRTGSDPVASVEAFGGVTRPAPGMPAHAIFYVEVADVAEACARIEEHGGKVIARELDPPAGPAFAYVHDPVGSLFGMYARPA